MLRLALRLGCAGSGGSGSGCGGGCRGLCDDAFIVKLAVPDARAVHVVDGPRGCFRLLAVRVSPQQLHVTRGGAPLLELATPLAASADGAPTFRAQNSHDLRDADSRLRLSQQEVVELWISFLQPLPHEILPLVNDLVQLSAAELGIVRGFFVLHPTVPQHARERREVLRREGVRELHEQQLCSLLQISRVRRRV